MTAAVHDQLVAELAREQVARLAPQELPLFRSISTAYFQDPGRLSASQGGADEMLGFGPELAVQMLTPIVLAVASEVVGFILEVLRRSAVDQSSQLIDAAAQKMLAKMHPEAREETPALTGEQLARVRAVAYKKARALRLPNEQAALLADSMVGSLSVTAA